MQKILKQILLGSLLTGFLSSCYKLEEPITTQITDDVFPETDEHILQAAGPTYTAFRGNFTLEYSFLQSLSTDEAILPARGGNWYDGARYEQLHKHTWNPDNTSLPGAWDWLVRTIGTSNQNIYLIEKAPDSDLKTQTLAELRTMRAITYFFFMDTWGNVPLVTKYGDSTVPRTTPRATVFNFIEQEINECLPQLSTVTGQSTYGRPTKYTAFALLAKMYLNAQVYTGSPRWNEAIAACDSIIQSEQYALESDYRNMFFINNGSQIKEFIFAIPFDPAVTSGYQFYARYNMPRALQKKYSLKVTPSAPTSTLPEFYAYYNDPNDIRNQQWITGKQYLYNGDAVIIATTKKGYDEDYNGADAGDAFNYHVELTPDVVVKNAGSFDLGNDEKAWNMGYRNNKFYADSTSANRNQNNDVPVFRYADILLMKAEAILRGGAPTMGQTALSLVNELRAVRTIAAAWSSVSLENIYAERCRELAWENWHRNDMIRFGKFEGSWGYKTDNDVNKRIFPIPTSAKRLNPLLEQNPGY